jgi:transaldolase/glucose-6-phosphate isomerase
LGAWLEQLLAESTGKSGKGLIPIYMEGLGAPEVYGQDRLFVYIRSDEGFDAKQDTGVRALEEAGFPLVRISLDNKLDLGQEFFCWEFATAVAGSILGINAFDQPDVEASKIVAKQLAAEFEKSGKLPQEPPLFEEDGLKVYADGKNAHALKAMVGCNRKLVNYLKAHLTRIQAGDYFALLAYVEKTAESKNALQKLRHQVRDSKKAATCLGFGPSFLHSTGQAYKGGPNSGVFLQITSDNQTDIPIPGQKYSFGVVEAAQAEGDFQVMAKRDRRILQINLGKDLNEGLSKLNSAIMQALASK